ncbi:MAG: tetratricopeptide repeat protein, partial [bacterium]
SDKIFKDVRKKFAGTNFGIQGEFGFGKSLLYQAKTEDALEVLTEIPRKYPGHPFLRAVYLNLGDFYKDQQQWGNAIQAFNNVLEDSTFDQYHKAALAKLSELYQSTGMYDASLAYSRQYITLFPNANESMTFKMRVGSLLRELKQYDEAIKYYRDLLPYAHGDDELAIQYFIGLSYFESKKYELAVAELLKLRYNNKPTKFPWKTTAIYRAGEAYMHLNNYDRAREMYDYVLRREGANSQMGSFALRKIAQIDEMLKSLQNSGRKS